MRLGDDGRQRDRPARRTHRATHHAAAVVPAGHQLTCALDAGDEQVGPVARRQQQRLGGAGMGHAAGVATEQLDVMVVQDEVEEA